jgi:hypothetical protein
LFLADWISQKGLRVVMGPAGEGEGYQINSTRLHNTAQNPRKPIPRKIPNLTEKIPEK